LAPTLTAVVLTILLLWMVGKAAQVFLLLFLAILISLYLGAVADLLHRRIHAPRRLAVFLAVLLSTGGVALLFWILVPPVVEQTQQLIGALPRHIATWETALDNALARLPGLQDWTKTSEHKVLLVIYDQLASYFSNFFSKLASILNATISVFSVAVMGLYLTLHPGLYREFLITLFPPVHRDLVRSVLGDLARTLRAYIVGQLTAMLLLGALTALGLYLLHVPYSLTFGVFTGLVTIIPFFGSLVSTSLPALFVLGGDGGLTRSLLVVGLGVLVHLFEGNVVSPLIMSKQVDLPPVLTIVAVLVLGKLLGGVGLLVALPTVAVVMVVVRRILINRIYEGQGFRRTMRDSVLLMRVPPSDGDVIVSPGPVDVVALAEEAQPQAVA
jgi:predicted PurR-regulated permease PerM